MKRTLVLLLNFRCDAQPALSEAEVFIIANNIQQLRRPDIHREACRSLAILNSQFQPVTTNSTPSEL